MLLDALKAYIQIANGLTEVTRERATAVAKSLAAQPGEVIGGAASGAAAAVGQVQSFAEEIILTSRDNRALLLGIVRTEVERAVAALGFAKEAEIDAVRHKIDKLQEAVGMVDEPAESASLRAALAPAKKKAPAKKAAKKATATKVPAKKVPPKKVAAKKAPAKKAVAKKAPAKKAPAVVASEAPSTPVAPAADPFEAAAFEAGVLEQESSVTDDVVDVAPTVVELDRPTPSWTPA